MLLRSQFSHYCEVVGRLQRSSRSSPWRRLFWRQLPLTFCANRLEPSATILMSALPPKAEISTFQLNVR